MSFVGRVAATRGMLIKLRDTLEFVRKGKEILTMKRDHLAGELNKLLAELKLRSEMEGKLVEIYEKMKKIYLVLGYSSVLTMASSATSLEVDVKPISIMGVVVPSISIRSRPDPSSIGEIGLYKVARELNSSIEELFRMAEIEARIERIAEELMMTNRKVNALEKVVLPTYENAIRYIEDRLFEESLEEFVRIKHVRDVIGRRKET